MSISIVSIALLLEGKHRENETQLLESKNKRNYLVVRRANVTLWSCGQACSFVKTSFLIPFLLSSNICVLSPHSSLMFSSTELWYLLHQ